MEAPSTLVVADISRVEHYGEEAPARDRRGEPQASIVSMITHTTSSNYTWADRSLRGI